MLGKLREIVEGWTGYLLNNPDMEEEAERRLSICIKCPENSTPNEIQKLSTCKKCGCVLGAKSFSKNSKCPIGKW